MCVRFDSFFLFSFFLSSSLSGAVKLFNTFDTEQSARSLWTRWNVNASAKREEENRKKKQKNKINEKKKIRRKKNEMENGESSFSLICAVNQTQLLAETGDIELPLDGHRFIESSRISKRSIRFIPFLTPSLNNHAAQVGQHRAALKLHA